MMHRFILKIGRKKIVKKLAVFAAATTLSLAVLTGCGAPSVETIVDGMYDTTFDSAKMDVTFEVDAAAEVEDEEYSAKASGEFTIDAMNVNSVEELSMAVTGSIEYDIMDGMLEDDMDVEAYIISEDDEQTVYFKDPESDEYYYQTNPIEESGVELSEKDMKKIQDAAKELWYTAEVGKKTEEINGEKCYVLTMTPSGADYVKLMDSVVKIMDMKDEWEDAKDMVEDELDASFEDILDNCNIEFTAYVSVKNKYMMGCKVDMSNIDIEGILDLFEDVIEDYDIEIGDITVDACNFSIMYSDINEVEVEVPKKVKKNAIEMASYGFGGAAYAGSTDVDIDDYDFDDDDDDDDYGFDDDDDDDVAVATASSDFYDEKSGEFKLYDYYDNLLYTFKMPKGYSMSYYDENDGNYYSLSSDDWEYIDIEMYTTLAVEYIIDNEQPDEDWYPNFECEYEEGKIGDTDVYFVSYSYDSSSGDYTYDYACILIPYHDDRLDKDKAITIELSDGLAEDWGNGSEKVIEELLMVK